MALCIPPPNTPAIARANTSPGKARNISEILISITSTALPLNPHIIPIIVPIIVITATSIRVEYILA